MMESELVNLKCYTMGAFGPWPPKYVKFFNFAKKLHHG